MLNWPPPDVTPGGEGPRHDAQVGHQMSVVRVSHVSCPGRGGGSHLTFFGLVDGDTAPELSDEGVPHLTFLGWVRGTLSCDDLSHDAFDVT